MREPCKHCNSKDCDDRECDRLGPVGELACIRCSKAVDAVARRGPCGGRVIEPSDDTWRSLAALLQMPVEIPPPA